MILGGCGVDGELVCVCGGSCVEGEMVEEVVEVVRVERGEVWVRIEVKKKPGEYHFLTILLKSRTDLEDTIQKDEKRLVISLAARSGMEIDHLHSFSSSSPLSIAVAVY